MYAPRAVAAMLERVRGAACAMQRSRGWQRVRCSGPDVQRSRGSTPWGWIIRGSSGENACGACVCVGRAEGPLANDLDDDNTKAKGGGRRGCTCRGPAQAEHQVTWSWCRPHAPIAAPAATAASSRPPPDVTAIVGSHAAISPCNAAHTAAQDAPWPSRHKLSGIP